LKNLRRGIKTKYNNAPLIINNAKKNRNVLREELRCVTSSTSEKIVRINKNINNTN